jgi:hypothetical protein
MLLKTIKGCSVCTVYLYLSVSSGGTWLIADQPLILEYKFAIIETYTLDFLLYILNLYLYNLYSSPQIYIFVFSQKLDNMHVWDGHQEIVFLMCKYVVIYSFLEWVVVKALGVPSKTGIQVLIWGMNQVSLSNEDWLVTHSPSQSPVIRLPWNQDCIWLLWTLESDCMGVVF